MSRRLSITAARRPWLWLLPLWLTVLLPASAAVYKWTDAEGITHFSDLPPLQGAQQIDVKPASLPPPDRPPPQGQAPAAPADATGTAAEGGQANPERAEYCRRARDDLKRYQAAERLVREDDQGKPVLIDDKERESLLEGLRKDIEKWCK